MMIKKEGFFYDGKPCLWIRLGVSKTRRFCPSEAKAARFQASLSSPFGRGTMPAQPSNGFLNTQPDPMHYPRCFHYKEKR
jgi:hypothetical protein